MKTLLTILICLNSAIIGFMLTGVVDGHPTFSQTGDALISCVCLLSVTVCLLAHKELK